MNKQRFAVIIVALIGLIATFLPWYKIVQLGTISGMSSSGWFTFIMFIIVIILALRKDLHEDLSMGISCRFVENYRCLVCPGRNV